MDYEGIYLFDYLRIVFDYFKKLIDKSDGRIIVFNNRERCLE